MDLQVEKKEAKKRRQEASAKGLVVINGTEEASVFTRAADIIDVDAAGDQLEETTTMEKKKKKKVLKKTKGQQRNQVSEADQEQQSGRKEKNKKNTTTA